MSHDKVRKARDPTAFKHEVDYLLASHPYVGDLPFVWVALCLRCTHYSKTIKGTDRIKAYNAIMDHLWTCHRGYVVLYMDGWSHHLLICDKCSFRQTVEGGERAAVELGETHLREEHPEPKD